MSSKVVSRLLIFFIGVPLVISLVMITSLNHLPLNILITLLSILGANELYNIFKTKFTLQNKGLVLTSVALTTLSGLFCATFNLDTSYINAVFVAVILICLAWEVIGSTTFENSNSKIITSVFIIFYTAFLFSFLTRMTMFVNSRQFIIVFLLMVFLCDSLAWFFGNLFGKNNKGFIKASPNKSIAGFCGGILGSIIAGLIGWYYWPEIFAGPVYKVIILGIIMSLSSIFGDLVESVFKRSGECKDSGNLVPGRGGILDSIDSIVYSAPFFYFIVTKIFEAEIFDPSLYL